MSEMRESTTEWLESLPAILRERRFESVEYIYSEKRKLWLCAIRYGFGKSSSGEGRNLEIASRKALEELDKQTWRRKETKDGSKRS